MCWVIGGLLSTGILTGLMKNVTQWGYRIPFALQWIWPVPIILATLLAPESPWWLVRQGRVTEAKAAIRKITTPTDGIEFDLDAHVEMMVVTNEYEKQVSAGSNYWHLFRGSDLHRTEVSAMAFITQALCGVPFMGFGTQFMQGVGLSQDDSFHLTIGQDCLGLIGCFIAWWIMTRFGRRPIYLVGLSAIFIILLIVGFIGLAPSTNKSASLAGGILIILMIFCFQVRFTRRLYALVCLLINAAFPGPHLLLARRRDPLVAPQGQDRRTFPSIVQLHRLHHKYHHAEDGWQERLELGRQGWILLGWHRTPLYRVGLLPSSRGKGLDLLRAGSTVRAQSLCTQVHSRGCRRAEACVDRYGDAVREAVYCGACGNFLRSWNWTACRTRTPDGVVCKFNQSSNIHFICIPVSFLESVACQSHGSRILAIIPRSRLPRPSFIHPFIQSNHQSEKTHCIIISALHVLSSMTLPFPHHPVRVAQNVTTTPIGPSPTPPRAITPTSMAPQNIMCVDHTRSIAQRLQEAWECLSSLQAFRAKSSDAHALDSIARRSRIFLHRTRRSVSLYAEHVESAQVRMLSFRLYHSSNVVSHLHSFSNFLPLGHPLQPTPLPTSNFACPTTLNPLHSAFPPPSRPSSSSSSLPTPSPRNKASRRSPRSASLRCPTCPRPLPSPIALRRRL
jgi:hypothetical protein